MSNQIGAGQDGDLVENLLQPERLSAAKLIGVDWGSSSLRVFLLDGAGELLAIRAAPLGASQMTSPADFAATLSRCAGHWVRISATPIPVIACGMVGSRHGWAEVPYLPTPANVDFLARNLGRISHTQVHVVPGLIGQSARQAPDVMRGEETQLLGALHLEDRLREQGCIILPGTHSKWASVVDEKILDFATHMTGELFSVLRQHSVLGKLLPAAGVEPGDADRASDAADSAFFMALRAVRDQPDAGLSHQLFAVRTLGLTEKLSAGRLADYLSGLLIGHEIQAGLTWRKRSAHPLATLVLVGEPELCHRYQQALFCFEEEPAIVLPNTAPTGLWCIARCAQLI